MSKFNPGANRAEWQQFKSRVPRFKNLGKHAGHLGPKLDAIEKRRQESEASLKRLAAELQKQAKLLLLCEQTLQRASGSVNGLPFASTKDWYKKKFDPLAKELRQEIVEVQSTWGKLPK